MRLFVIEFVNGEVDKAYERDIGLLIERYGRNKQKLISSVRDVTNEDWAQDAEEFKEL